MKSRMGLRPRDAESEALVKWSDRNTILATAAQYDLQLAWSRAAEVGQPVF